MRASAIDTLLLVGTLQRELSPVTPHPCKKTDANGSEPRRTTLSRVKNGRDTESRPQITRELGAVRRWQRRVIV